MQRLKCCHQEYEWGKTGENSRVGKIVKTGAHFDGRKSEKKGFDSSKPFAELWMGTHNNGPSFIFDDKTQKVVESLKEFLQKNESKSFDLPFLFKVLSVNKALSIQTHPTKEQAVLLHSRDPKNYPDDNHKPEMAIAVTEFQMLCGFAPWNEITANLENFPEVQSLTGNHSGAPEEQLKKSFTSLWKSPSGEIAACVEKIISRISTKGDKSTLEELMIRLNGQFLGGDVGVLAPIFMNYIVLKPREAVYLGANVPHAYLDGDCIECMACSDNTIRAGLTPKFKDVDTLCEYMNWTMGSPPFVKPGSGPKTVYTVDNQKEFMIQKWEAAVNKHPKSPYFHFHPKTGTNSIWVILQGNGAFVQEGELDNLTVKSGDVVLKPSSGEAYLLCSADFLAYSALVPETEKDSEDWDTPRMKKFEEKIYNTIDMLYPEAEKLPLF